MSLGSPSRYAYTGSSYYNSPSRIPSTIPRTMGSGVQSPGSPIYRVSAPKPAAAPTTFTRRPDPAPRVSSGYEDLTLNDYRSARNEMPTPPARIARDPRPARVDDMKMEDRTAAENAAYGRARDAAGMEARGAADSLADEMSARGLAGAGLEGALLGGILQTSQGQLGEVNRELAIDRMRRADQIADTNYAGRLQQRSQDMNWSSGARGQDITQRGQDINAGETRASNAMRLMELLRRTRRL